MEFIGFPKIARLSREVIITEKIDGTNAQIYIPNPEDVMEPFRSSIPFLVGSRSRWITPDSDNHGFARWCYDHMTELFEGLGPGRHFGEWWGSGIQRGYGLKKGEKRFSLFNVLRWEKEVLPECCSIVPVIDRLDRFDSTAIQMALDLLEDCGSMAAPGYMNPEGIVVYHVAGNVCFKKTLGNDGNKGVINGR